MKKNIVGKRERQESKMLAEDGWDWSEVVDPQCLSQASVLGSSLNPQSHSKILTNGTEALCMN